MKLLVLDTKNKILFKGTKAEVNAFIKKERLNKLQYTLKTAPIEQAPPEPLPIEVEMEEEDGLEDAFNFPPINEEVDIED